MNKVHAIRVRCIRQPDRLMIVDKIDLDGPPGADPHEILTLLPDEAGSLLLALEAAVSAMPGTYIVSKGGRVQIDESTT